jgi:hypothetical protein
MSPSAEWEAAYEATQRDFAVAARIITLLGIRRDDFDFQAIAREIGIAIARAIEAEIAPAEAV